MTFIAFIVFVPCCISPVLKCVKMCENVSDFSKCVRMCENVLKCVECIKLKGGVDYGKQPLFPRI